MASGVRILNPPEPHTLKQIKDRLGRHGKTIERYRKFINLLVASRKFFKTKDVIAIAFCCNLFCLKRKLNDTLCEYSESSQVPAKSKKPAVQPAETGKLIMWSKRHVVSPTTVSTAGERCGLPCVCVCTKPTKVTGL